MDTNQNRQETENIPQEKSEHSVRSNESPKFIEEIERKSDIPAAYIMSGLAFCFALVFFGYLEIQITSIASIIFPIYWTLKAIEKPEEGDDKQWATYWIIFAFFFVIDILFSKYLNMIPFFYAVKFIAFMWLYLPNTRGALWLHENLIARFFGPIDLSKIKNAKEEISHKMDSMIDKINKEKEEAEAKIREEERKIKEEEDRMKEIERKKIEEEEREREREREIEKQKHFRPMDSFPEPEESSSHNLEEPSKSAVPDFPINTSNNYFNNNNNNLNKMHSYSEKDSKTSNYGSSSNQETAEHESRQNIISDAKLRTDNLQSGLQNVKQQIDQSAERIKGLKDNLTGPTPLDQEHLLTAGKEIAGTTRINMDPKFGMEDLGNDKIAENKKEYSPKKFIEKSNDASYMTKEHQIHQKKPEEEKKVL